MVYTELCPNPSRFHAISNGCVLFASSHALKVTKHSRSLVFDDDDDDGIQETVHYLDNDDGIQEVTAHLMMMMMMMMMMMVYT
jgi:hypothetical protein